MPGIATSDPSCSDRIARTRASGLSPESTASAKRGPTPLTATSRSNSLSSSRSANPNSATASSRTTWRVRRNTGWPAAGSTAAVWAETLTR